MPLQPPTPAQLADAALDEFRALVAEAIAEHYAPLDRLPEAAPEPRYPRGPWRRPGPGEDPLDAWHVLTALKGAPAGPLAGRAVAIKDNISVAGVPMTNGASILEGYVPETDATVVTRILDAGGEIAGKASCEYFCWSGGSHTDAAGPTRNPHRPGHSAGGSSSGCAALVGAGTVALAVGGDQGGSIRVPSAFCGIVGLKPTYGLVPYTGAASIEMTLDHLGPMTATVDDNALLLEVLAGPDGLDPRQGSEPARPYRTARDLGIVGLRIGVLAEGFDWPHGEPDVDAKVRSAAALLGRLGADVRPLSVPAHRHGMLAWTPIAVEGSYDQLLLGNGLGSNWRGFHQTSLRDALAGWHRRSDEFSEVLKLGMLLAAYVREASGGRYYSKAQNLSLALRAAYDAALAECDLLLLPTSPIKAPPLPPAGGSRAQQLSPGFRPITNTAPFDATGHPAISLPCGMSDGLPVGLMLVGRHGDELGLYRAAYAFEAAADWREL